MSLIITERDRTFLRFLKWFFWTAPYHIADLVWRRAVRPLGKFGWCPTEVEWDCTNE
jgi:hypothetical protein